ncbi:MAG: SurA N-terminal domain-containing protein [Aestuariivirgaceae bacterium]
MADSVRLKAGNWTAKIFIAVLAASFAVWGIADVFSTRPPDTIAEVGTRQVRVEDFRRMFERQLRLLSQQLGQSLTADQGRQLGVDRQVLAQLLRDAALEAQGDELNLQVSDASVAQRIANTKQFQTSDGSFNADQFRRLLRTNGLSEQMFVASERQGMVRASIANTIERGAAVPNSVAELAHRFRNEQRDVSYFTATVDEASISAPSDSDLKSFYDANQQLFEIPEHRVIAALQVTPGALADRISVSDEDVRKSYEDRKSDYGTPEKRTLEQIAFDNVEDAQAAKAKIDGGASFVDVAKEKGLSEADIKLGTFTRQNLPDPSLAEAAFSLSKDAVSQPVAGRLSTVLLKVVGIEPGSQQSLDEVKDQIKQRLQLDGARDEVLAIYEKVEEARASGQSMEEIAKDLSLSVDETAPVDRSGQTADGTAVEGLADASSIVRAAFESDIGIDNDPVTTRDDGYVWFEVRDIQTKSVRPLDEVREDAVKAWKSRQLRVAVVEKAKELKNRAEAGEALSKLAAESKAEIVKQQGIKRNEASEAFDSAAVQALFSVREDGFAFAVNGDGKGAKVMQSSPVLAPPFDAGSGEAKSLQQELSTALTNDLYAQYLSDLQRRLGVQIDENVLSNAGNTAYQQQRY